MGKLSDFLSGSKILEEVNSPINGKVTVVKSLAWGTYIQVEGLTQSGGIMHGVWRKPLKKLQNSLPRWQAGKTPNIQKVLILGLGGGTVAKLVREFWPKVKIAGVDLDPVMVELGKKYLGLNSLGVNVEIGDALEFMRKQSKFKSKNKYDLILVDLYVGQEYPEKFESESFLRLVLRLLTNNGIAVFNRLYYGEKRPQAVKFGQKLEKIFRKVDVVYPEANIMFICSR